MIIPVKKLSAIQAIAFDFDGVFTDNLVYVMQNGDEAVACNRSDGMGISMLLAVGVPLVIISTDKNPIVTVRGAKLNIQVIQGVCRRHISIDNKCHYSTPPLTHVRSMNQKMVCCPC